MSSGECRPWCFACPASFSSFCDFLFSTQNKGGGTGPPGLSPRFATEECRSWIAHRIFHCTKWPVATWALSGESMKKSPFGLFGSRERNFKSRPVRCMLAASTLIKFFSMLSVNTTWLSLHHALFKSGTEDDFKMAKTG